MGYAAKQQSRVERGTHISSFYSKILLREVKFYFRFVSFESGGVAAANLEESGVWSPGSGPRSLQRDPSSFPISPQGASNDYPSEKQIYPDDIFYTYIKIRQRCVCIKMCILYVSSLIFSLFANRVHNFISHENKQKYSRIISLISSKWKI